MFLHLCVILLTWGVCLQRGLHPPRSASRGLARPPSPIGYYRIRSTNGWYASYWNAFLFNLYLWDLGFNKVIRTLNVHEMQHNSLTKICRLAVTTTINYAKPANSIQWWHLNRKLPWIERNIIHKIKFKIIKIWNTTFFQYIKFPIEVKIAP